MSNHRRLQRAIRLALGGALGLASGVTCMTALAQQTGTGEVETIYVTGSRIARGSDFENPSPVVTVDQRATSTSRATTTCSSYGEACRSNGNGTFSTRGNNQDSTANGAASISLRGLGADATLVLVNGRRVAISSFAESITTNFVDINSIPVAAIERVEVLKDGASAVYGSDAVAGVVNIILRKDFEGFETRGQLRQRADGPYDEVNASAIWGIGGEDSNVTFDPRLFQEFDPDQHRARHARHGRTRRRGRPGLPLLARLSRPLHRERRWTLIDPACPAGQLARADLRVRLRSVGTC